MVYHLIVSAYSDLSHGRFLGDNQKRLAGPDSGIPIFEAKVTGDTRLVVRCAITCYYFRRLNKPYSIVLTVSKSTGARWVERRSCTLMRVLTMPCLG